MRSIGGKIRWREKEIKESDKGEGEREWLDGQIEWRGEAREKGER